MKYYSDLENKLVEAAKIVKTTPDKLADKLTGLLAENKALASELESLKAKAAQDAMGDVMNQVVEVKETGNECFERILFFVKPEYAGLSEGKIRERAGLAAQSATLPPPTRLNRKSRLNGALKIALSAVSGIAVGILIGLMFG